MKRTIQFCKDEWVKILVGLISVAIPALITLANGKIDVVEKNTKIYVDTKHDGVVEILRRHEKVLDRLDKRVYDLHKEMKKK